MQKFSNQWHFFVIAECLSFFSFSSFSILWISCSLYKLGFIFIQWNKNQSSSYKSQPRTGIFFNGEFGPRRMPWLLIPWPPCYKNKPFPTVLSPEPLYGFKSSPWPSVSTLAMFEPFLKCSPFPMALFVAFCTKADPTLDSAPVANVGRTVFTKNGKALAAKPANIKRNPPSVFMLWTSWH